MISTPMVRLTQTVHLSWIKNSTISKWTKLSLEPHHLGVPSGASKTISMPMVRSTQTCTYLASRFALSLKGWSFDLSHVTNEYHRVPPKWFLSRWYNWRKLCTYVALTLILSLNGHRRDFTWPTLPRGSIRCVQNDFRAYGTFDANRAPILHQD
jgi:hypothetical protein